MKVFLRGDIKIFLISIGIAIIIYFLLGFMYGMPQTVRVDRSYYDTQGKFVRNWRTVDAAEVYRHYYSQGERLGVGIGVFLIIFGILRYTRSKQK